ncbi:MAG TPA: sigma-54-dependent Fis family transcriptional regulator [Rhodospirillaceae bacterium]|nr:sigma-54-dependent Fis family transcriptional regulator [Rhodospirillaceae bacterium]
MAGLGSDVLAALLLEQVGRDPALIARLRPLLSGGGRVPRHAAVPEMVGGSGALQALRRILGKVAQAHAPVLITGESGTGKELAAIAIHQHSPRAKGPFVPINCAALPKTLIASELFGYEKGAFTGADQRRIGRIQSAHKGTLFLDEIGDLPLDLQAHLLRFLQEGTIDRVGAPVPIKVDVRIVAATNLPLRKAVADGQFREDLYFRLNVLTVEMPPLRDRGEDIDQLAGHFVAQFSAEAGKALLGLSPEAEEVLRHYRWPGNIRELIACLRRAVVMADGPWIRPADLGLPLDAVSASSLRAVRRGVEEDLVRNALSLRQNSITLAAQHLGVSRVTLYRMIEKYRITVGERRPPVR